MTWLFPPRVLGVSIERLLGSKASRRLLRGDLEEISPSTTFSHGVAKAADRRRAIENVLLGGDARSVEFIEIPPSLQGSERVLQKRGIEASEEQSGQVARLMVQLENPALLLAERLVDAIICWARANERSLSGTRVRIDAALDRQWSTSVPRSHRLGMLPDVLVESFRWRWGPRRWPHGSYWDVVGGRETEFQDAPFPYRAVVETNTDGLMNFLSDPETRDWIGLEVDSSPAYGEAQSNSSSACASAAPGVISGCVKVFDIDGSQIATLWATCSHVVRRCGSVVVRGNDPSPQAAWSDVKYEGQVCHAPDAALIDMTRCACIGPQPQRSGPIPPLTWPYGAEAAAVLHLSAKYLGTGQRRTRGYVLAPHNFWAIKDHWYRCPALELQPYRSRLDQLLGRNRGFSGPGDSGGWITNEQQEWEWLGMINADRPMTGSSFATEARYLSFYFLEECRRIYGPSVRIRMETV